MMPIYTCLMVAILLFFRIMTVLMTVEVAIHEVAEEAAYSGIEVEEALLGAAVSAKVAGKEDVLYYIDHGILGLTYFESKVNETDVDLVVNYRVSVPVGIFGPVQFRVRQEAKHRRWVGYDPSLGHMDHEEYVYVAKYGEDYHSRRDCPYLAPSIHTVAGNQVTSLRNADGHRYRACSYCHPGKSGDVYVTDYGETYHKSTTCLALKRTISYVPISEVGGRRPCPKCYKGGLD
ncbi:MAG: hypothetical protein K6G04_07935 [Lachnospiraceae bacterium]|nr:hypothetical protein [Lachnospiraceae bacterium]